MAPLIRAGSRRCCQGQQRRSRRRTLHGALTRPAHGCRPAGHRHWDSAEGVPMKVIAVVVLLAVVAAGGARRARGRPILWTVCRSTKTSSPVSKLRTSAGGACPGLFASSSSSTRTAVRAGSIQPGRSDKTSRAFPSDPSLRHPFLTAQVTCLNVTGNRATIGVELLDVPAAVRWVLWSVEDNDGAGQDKTGTLLIGQVATVCPANPSIAVSPIFGGDITVHDAPSFPIAKGQCKNGDWHNFPAFKNQGQCIAFVEQGPKH